MRELAPGVHMLSGLPPNAINVYLVDGIIVDAATRLAGRRILRQLRGHEVKAHALTHAHPDHQGASRELCEKLGIELWCGAADADAAENPELIRQRQPDVPINRFVFRVWAGPGHPVARKLSEGDTVGSFTVLEVPGHSAGHVAYWRESDRVLIAGDVFNNMNVITGIPGLHEPLRIFTPDPARNRESMRRLAELDPQLVLFGHGPPLRRDAASKLRRFVEQLPSTKNSA